MSNVFNDYFNNIVADVGQHSGYNNVNVSEVQDNDFDVYLTNVLQEYESHPQVLYTYVEILYTIAKVFPSIV